MPEGGLQALEQAGSTASCCPQPGAAAGLAGLFVILAAAHFFLDAAPFDELTEPADRFLNAFAVANVQLNHASSFGLIA